MKRILTLPAIVALACTTLVACVPGSGPSPAAPAASSPAASSSSPAPTKPALEDLVLGPDGLGNLLIGDPVPTDPAQVALVKFDPIYCKEALEDQGQVFTLGAPFAGAWLPTYSNPLAFDVFTIGGAQSTAITEIGAGWYAPDSSSPIHTETGIHPGSSTADLKAAYPKFDSVRSFAQSDVYQIKGHRGILVFEVTPPSDPTGFYSPEELNRVVSIWAMDATSTEDERGPRINTDGWGHCG